VRPLAQERDAPASAGIPGTIDDISYLIDVNQHNAVVKGHIDNPECKLRGGQFVSCTVQLPPPADVVEVPMTAIVDDGRQCVVFVQADPSRPHYTLRRVEVRQRFDKTAFVRSRLTKKEMELTPEEKEQDLLPPPAAAARRARAHCGRPGTQARAGRSRIQGRKRGSGLGVRDWQE
jgi:multidrug efflux pump subunit AcrA (membrane-fusion protein)